MNARHSTARTSTRAFSRLRTVTLSRERSLAFANRHFGGCRRHIDEAADVHRALEWLSDKEQPDLAPDSSIGAVLERSTAPADSLDTVEFQMALEEEIGASLEDGASSEWGVFCVLLGTSATKSSHRTDAPTRLHARGRWISLAAAPSRARE